MALENSLQSQLSEMKKNQLQKKRKNSVSVWFKLILNIKVILLYLFLILILNRFFYFQTTFSKKQKVNDSSSFAIAPTSDTSASTNSSNSEFASVPENMNPHDQLSRNSCIEMENFQTSMILDENINANKKFQTQHTVVSMNSKIRKKSFSTISQENSAKYAQTMLAIPTNNNDVQDPQLPTTSQSNLLSKAPITEILAEDNFSDLLTNRNNQIDPTQFSKGTNSFMQSVVRH